MSIYTTTIVQFITELEETTIEREKERSKQTNSGRIVLVKLPGGRVGGAARVPRVMEEVVCAPCVIAEADVSRVDRDHKVAAVAAHREYRLVLSIYIQLQSCINIKSIIKLFCAAIHHHHSLFPANTWTRRDRPRTDPATWRRTSTRRAQTSSIATTTTTTTHINSFNSRKMHCLRL